VLAHGRKLAGILAELRHAPSGTELVLGIGINVQHEARDFDASLRGSAVSLRMLRNGTGVEREDVASALLGALGAVIEKLRRNAWREVAERFLSYAPDGVGRRVRLAAGGSGTTDGLDDSGALRVATGSGIVLVHASESVAAVEE